MNASQEYRLIVDKTRGVWSNRRWLRNGGGIEWEPNGSCSKYYYRRNDWRSYLKVSNLFRQDGNRKMHLFKWTVDAGMGCLPMFFTAEKENKCRLKFWKCSLNWDPPKKRMFEDKALWEMVPKRGCRNCKAKAVVCKKECKMILGTCAEARGMSITIA